MARAALGWSTRDLAEKAGVSPSTVNQFEQGIVASNRSTLGAIRRAFEEAGLEFTNGDKPGVAIAINAKERLKRKSPPR